MESRKLVLAVLVVLLALLTVSSCAGSPRVNGLFVMEVWYLPPDAMINFVVCEIGPLEIYSVGAQDEAHSGWWFIDSGDMGCDGWAWLP